MLDIAEPQLRLSRPAANPSPYETRKPVSREIVAGCVQVADFGAIMLAGSGAFVLYLYSILGSTSDSDRYSLTTTMGALIFLFLMRKTGAYRFRRLAQWRWQFGHVALIWMATISMMSTVAFLSKAAEAYSRGWAITYATFALALFFAVRIVIYGMIRRWKAHGRLARLVGIVGAGDVGERLIAKLKMAGDTEVEIAGVFDDRLTRVPPIVAGCPVIGTTLDLVSFAQSSRLDEIIIALPMRAADRITELVERLRLLPVDIRLSIDNLAGAFPMVGVGETASVPVINILDRPLKHWNGVIKMLEDRVLGAVALLLLLPVMAIVAVLIRLDSRGPVLFIQDRFGFNNRSVRVMKFRTMHVAQSDPSGAQRTVRNDPRITRIGGFLRKTSLDELPQLFNVLRGEMSLVGPRAHAVAMRAGDHLYHEAVTEYFQRHKVRPGMTGWAQVHGLRGEIEGLESARQRVAHDLHYIDHWSLWLDLKILFLTIRVLFSHQNAY